jgi:hypothetical protein
LGFSFVAKMAFSLQKVAKILCDLGELATAIFLNRAHFTPCNLQEQATTCQGKDINAGSCFKPVMEFLAKQMRTFLFGEAVCGGLKF